MPYFSITNYTQVPLHIALSHLGPVHYYNNLQPNQTVTLSVGKVWFTVEAKVASGENDYKWHHVAVPIVAATVVGVASVAALGVMATAVSADAALATLFTYGRSTLLKCFRIMMFYFSKLTICMIVNRCKSRYSCLNSPAEQTSTVRSKETKSSRQRSYPRF
jgi:hypothetical protein